jgi:hypothetical protein
MRLGAAPTAVVAVVAMAAVVVAATPAAAGPNDIELLGLVDRTDPAAPVVRNEDFRSLVRELGLIFTPSGLQPAETTGIAGFDFAVDYAFHVVNLDRPYWQDALEERGGRVPMTIGARARKGFILPVPLASEVEVGAQWLIESQMFNVGGNIRVALNEGFTGAHWWAFIPDVAVQAGFNRVVGSDDLELLTATAGGTISKGFGLFGMVNLCPFAGYQSVFVNGSTRLVDTNPQMPNNVDDNVVFDIVRLTDNRIDRYSVGARLVVAHIQLSGGVDISVLSPDDVIYQPAFRAGVSF